MATKAYLLPPLVRLTDEIGSGSSLTGKTTHHVPTPTASDHIERNSTSTEALNFEMNKSVSLDRWVNRWPTPTTDDANQGERARASGTISSLSRAAKYGYANALPQDYERTTAPIGSLNPTWVEWLMGFPLGWTDLDR